MPNPIVLVEARRDPVVESSHSGSLAVCDPSGRLLAYAGDPDALVFLRSSAKPFQLLPLLESGAADALGFSEAEIAIACASHSGTDEHVAVLQGLQDRLGLSESLLQCGVHDPYDDDTYDHMLLRGEDPSANRNNCSGKHTAMLALAMHWGVSLENYLESQHPVQQAILQAVAGLCGLRPEEVTLGVDGCSAPVFAVPLRNAAMAYARLVDPTDLPPERAAACRRITQAMLRYPYLVAGPGRFDTALMRSGGGVLLAKGGAEGYQAVGILPAGIASGRGAGLTLKICDGDPNGRARSAAALEVLRQLHVTAAILSPELDGFDRRPLRNWRGVQVGEIEPCFTLAVTQAVDS